MTTSPDFTGIIRDFSDIEECLSDSQLFELAIHFDGDFLRDNSHLLEDAAEACEESFCVRDGLRCGTGQDWLNDLSHGELMNWIASCWVAADDLEDLRTEAVESLREDCRTHNERCPEHEWYENVNHVLGNPCDYDMVVELGRILTALECLADPNEAICDGIQRDCDVAINMGSGPDLVDVRKLALNLVERVSPRVREYVQDHC